MINSLILLTGSVEDTRNMAYKLTDATEGSSDNLDIFTKPVVDTSILQREWIDYRPISQISKGSPLIFHLPGTSMDYLDLKNFRLYTKCSIKKPNGQPVIDTDKVALINLPHGSMFRQVDLMIQNQPVSSGVGINYAYKAYLDATLEHTEDAKSTHMQSRLYYKDSSSYFDAIDPSASANVGLADRWAYTKDGQAVELEGPLSLDLCKQERYVPNGIEVGIRLVPNSDAFTLMCDGTVPYQLSIDECILRACTVKVNPGILVGHAEAFKKSPACFPYTRSDIKPFNVAQGSLSCTVENLFQGQVPDKLIVGIVSSSNYVGTYSKNPFNFDHKNCSYLDFSVDGQRTISNELQPEAIRHSIQKSI